MGRHPTYQTPKEMQEKIDQYFAACQPAMETGKPPTITGLALALGFTSRQALLNYQGKPNFVDTVTRAKSKVEEYTECRLFDRDGVRGALS